MSSTLRAYKIDQINATKFQNIKSVAYDDDGTSFLFPFTCEEGVLDISLEGNNFEQLMIAQTGRTPGHDVDGVVRVLGGTRYVTSLGPNFLRYIRAWRTPNIDLSAPIQIITPGILSRVQVGDLSHVGEGDSFEVSNSLPESDNYICSGARYCTTYIFKSPLTISIKENGTRRFITFKSTLL
jgi:hypothetical protein